MVVNLTWLAMWDISSTVPLQCWCWCLDNLQSSTVPLQCWWSPWLTCNSQHLCCCKNQQSVISPGGDNGSEDVGGHCTDWEWHLVLERPHQLTKARLQWTSGFHIHLCQKCDRTPPWEEAVSYKRWFSSFWRSCLFEINNGRSLWGREMGQGEIYHCHPHHHVHNDCYRLHHYHFHDDLDHIHHLLPHLPHNCHRHPHHHVHGHHRHHFMMFLVMVMVTNI